MGIKPSRYEQHFWRLLQASTYSHHQCGVWLWAFPSSSHLVAAAFCLSSACPFHPPSFPPLPLEWGSTPHSWWFLKEAQVKPEVEMPRTSEITKCCDRESILSLFFFFYLSCFKTEVKESWCRASKLKWKPRRRRSHAERPTMNKHSPIKLSARHTSFSSSPNWAW